MKTIVVGLGNPLLGDDGVGWRVAQAVEERLGGLGGEVEFRLASLGGIALMEMLLGFEKAILVDSICCAGGPAGAVRRLTMDDLPGLYASSSHDVSFKDALRLGESLGAPLPAEIVVIAVEITPQAELSEQLSPQVGASISPAAELVLAELPIQT